MSRNFIYLLIGRILQGVIGIIAVKMVTKFLSQKELGIYYLIGTFVSLYGLFLAGPVGQYFNRKTIQWYEGKELLSKLFTLIAYFLAAIFVFIAILYVTDLAGFSISDKGWWATLPVICLGGFFNALIGTSTGIFNFINKRLVFVILNNLTLGSSLLTSVALVHYFGAGGELWYWGQVISQGFFCIVALILLRRLLDEKHVFIATRHSIRGANYRRIFDFCWPLAIVTFFTWTYSDSYRIFAKISIGLEFLALIGVGLTISLSIASVFESLFQQIYFPIYYRNISNADEQRRTIAFEDLLSKSIPVYFLVALYVTAMSNGITRFLTNEKYLAASLFLVFGIWINFFRMVSNVASLAMHAEYKTRHLIKAFMIGGIFNFSGLYWIAKMPYHPQWGFPVVLLITGIIMLVNVLKDARRLVEYNLFHILRRIWKPLLLGTLFFIPEYGVGIVYDSFLKSVVTVGGMGVFFLGILWFMYKNEIKSE
ncbi:MAG: hypothetical protein OHK0056_32990 [Bacteriovoracaceae bacterium]